jgi:hypothetical protein
MPTAAVTIKTTEITPPIIDCSNSLEQVTEQAILFSDLLFASKLIRRQISRWFSVIPLELCRCDVTCVETVRLEWLE